MAGLVEEEGKYSRLSSGQRESLASQGREVFSRRRQKQLRGGKESADWTAAVQSEVEKSLAEMRESHERKIEKIRANGEEEKSRELSLLSEELTKQYKYHIEQLESRLQLATGVNDVTGGDVEAFKRDVEQQASSQVQQYYQQYRIEVEDLQSELDRISEERDLAFEENRSLLVRIEELESGTGGSEEWECEKVSLEQRVQEADTKVSGLERMLAEKRGEVEGLLAERDETRDILDTRNKEKMALSRHFTDQIQVLEQEREGVRENARGLENELLSSRTDLSELRELLERRENEKRQLAEQIHKSVNVSQYVSALEREKQELANANRTGELEASRLSEELEAVKCELVQLETQKSVIFRGNSELKEKVGVLESQMFAVRDYKSAVEERVSELQSARERSESEARELSQRLGEVERGKHEADNVISSLRREVEGKESKVMEVSEEADRLRGELDLKVREVENLREEVRNIETQRNESVLHLTNARERISLLQTELEREELVAESESNYPQLSLTTRNEEMIRLSNEITALQTYKKSMDEEKVYLELRGREQDSLIRRVRALKEAEERDYQILLQRMPATRS